MSSSRLNPGRAAAGLAAAVALLAAPNASAAVQAELRVEGAGRQLAAGMYVTDSASVRTTTSPPSCNGSGQVKTVQGPTALGLVVSAAAAGAALRPLAVSDEFDFGLLVCGIGDLAGSDASFWLYKVDHKAAEVGADQFPLEGGEQVLWYFSDTAAGVNTGVELGLQAPARATAGSAVEVTAWAYDAAGARTPAAGATVLGETTDGQGKASVSVPRGARVLRLRAERGGDVPSPTLTVCVKAEPSCPPRRGQRVFGSKGDDRITGTAGADTVSGLGGADRIDVHGAGRDFVRCGKGRDRVRADRRDRVARDCERVRRG